MIGCCQLEIEYVFGSCLTKQNVLHENREHVLIRLSY